MAGNDDGGRGRCNRKCVIIVACVIIFFVCVIIIVPICILVLREDDGPDLPQYSVLNAVLSQNATVTNKNLITADFAFTLKATNTNKKNITIFYGNTTHVSVTRTIRQQVIASTWSPLFSPSRLGPGNSSDVTVNLRAQNTQFAFPINDDDDTSPDTVYYLVLRMRFRVGFEEGSNYGTKVEVNCYNLKCSFPSGFTADNSPTCRTDDVSEWQYFPGDEEQGRP